jgi:hypothetical protein
MHQYENTKFLKPYLDSHEDQIRRGVEEAAAGDDQVQIVADVLSDVLSQDSEIQAAMVEAFWKSIDWRLLAEMHLGMDMGSSI